MNSWASKALAVVAVVAGVLSVQLPVAAHAADPTPSAGASSGATTAVANYQNSLSDYSVANSAYNAIRSSALQSNKSLQAGYQAALKAFNKADQARNAAVRAISLSFATDVQLATKTYRQSLKSATTADLKIQATTAFNNAVSAASGNRDTALSQLTPLPSAPAKPFVPMPPVPAPVASQGSVSDGESQTDEQPKPVKKMKN